jgi:hypothetical protein
MPLWSDDPVVIVLSIVAVWGFLAACVLHDRLLAVRARRGAGFPAHRVPLYNWEEDEQ